MSSVSDSCEPRSEVAKAYYYFKSVNSQEMLPWMQNGLGTVFACRVVYYLRDAETQGASTVAQREVFACASLRDCLAESSAFYKRAADGTEVCGFLDERFRNNDLDLYLKLGLHYSEAQRSLTSPPFVAKVGTPEKYSDTVELKLSNLLQCLQQQFVPAIFLSAAQANGVLATVRDQTPRKKTYFVSSAGHYLRLAFAWLPGATLESDFSYYCPAVDVNGRVDREFRAAYDSALPGLEAGWDEIEQAILRTCSNTRC